MSRTIRFKEKKSRKMKECITEKYNAIYEPERFLSRVVRECVIQRDIDCFLQQDRKVISKILNIYE